MRRIVLLLLCFWTVGIPGFGQGRPPVEKFEFKDGDRVVFLGGTWMEREQQTGHIEALITSRLQGKKVIFRNLAWSGDTVLGVSRAGFDAPETGFDRLKEQLTAIKPTVAFLAYGMAESFQGEAGLEKFRKEMNLLMDTITEISKPDGVRFVIMTPTWHEKLPPPLPDPVEHNAQLELYSDALKELAAERGARVIDLFTAMRNYAQVPGATPFTDNGIHPTPYGYWNIAYLWQRDLGLQPALPRVSIDEDGKVRGGSRGIKIASVSKDEDRVTFDGEDEFMLQAPKPYSPHETNDSTGFLLRVEGLKPGKYTLKIDGVPSAVYTAEQWGRGRPVNRGPNIGQAEELRETIVRKNRLFFHRWRPQNQTYLFGFRRHEQGQNAKEIPMFDPLIAEQEAKIFQLTELKKRRYELVPTQPGDEEKLDPKAKEASTIAEIDQTPLPRPTFDHPPELEITLFAENPNLAKPIQMNFDPEGRLWVASSSVYPQIQPGQEADDKILILEDVDKDGKADKTTVFADGLLIPTGVEPGDGGAYVANSTELLFYKDTDGDGRADEKRVMLSGFGTEDTHHILHTLRWGHDGQLYMNQSIYIHSHIETPHGVVRLDSGGILNLRPPTQELGIHMKGLINSWGHHFDRYGQSFATDGAGGEGINWIIPQAMYVTYEGARRILHGVSPGSYPKFCGLEVIESEHFPEDWQGDMVTCDFRANRVVRFGLNNQGAGYVTEQLPDVMRTTNVTFRPIDVKVGPDGAIYIADWSNPIIQHGEVDFRDPRRDHEHGRIWRITYKGRPLVKQQNLREASNGDLLANLASENGHLRQQSRRVLTERGEVIKSDLDAWTAKQETEQGKLEALWMYQSIDVVNAELLKEVLAAKNEAIRAAGMRVLSFWHERLENPLDLVAAAVADESGRVRVEAVRTAAKIPSARSAELVLQAVEKPMDRFIDYAIWLSINDLAEPWVAAVRSGEWKWEGREKQLEFALNAVEPGHAAVVLTKVLAEKPLPKDGSGPWISLIAKAGSREHLEGLFEQVLTGDFTDGARANALNSLAEAARLRQLAPAKNREKLASLFEGPSAPVRAAAVRLAGQWKVQSASPALLKLAGKDETPAEVRTAAFQSLREIGGTETVEGLTALAKADLPLPVRTDAVRALSALDMAKGAPLAIEVLTAMENEEAALNLWRALLANKGAAAVFARELPKAGLPAPMVKSGMRAAREGGRNEPNLVLALARNMEGGGEAQTLSPEELKRLLTFIQEKGDPGRGELVYRRQELGCVSCHAIGGAGGKVGPDLTSIGASAPPDYMVEALVFPNRKVKEGYHSIIVETDSDMEFSGILVRETADQLVIRDASNREVSVPKAEIVRRTIGGSIMPAGLIDALSEQEQADLYRFLTELGKKGPYDASKGNVARVWELLPRTLDVSQFSDDKVVTMEKTATVSFNTWSPVMTLVDGRLLKAELEGAINAVRYRDPDAIFAKTHFEVPRSGKVQLKLPALEKAAAWIDGKQVEAGQEIAADLESGKHTLVLKLDAKKLPGHLAVSSEDATFVQE